VIPAPLNLPIRPPEAAEFARLIFQQAEGKRLSDDVVASPTALRNCVWNPSGPGAAHRPASPSTTPPATWL
jgi:hypothetical protein